MKLSTQKGSVIALFMTAVALAFVGIILYTTFKPGVAPYVPVPIFPTPTPTVTVTPTPTQATSSMTTNLRIALLINPTYTAPGMPTAGCDAIIFKGVEVPYTLETLNASMKALFADKTPWPPAPDIPGNFVSAQKNLTFDKVTLSNGVAKIYLKGQVMYAGVCDDPRLDSQISFTAKQFVTVKSVQIYINNKLWTVPSEKGE